MNESLPKKCRCKSQGSRNLCSKYRGAGRDLEDVEDVAYYSDVGKRISQCGISQVNDEYAPIDPQTLNTISSMRKKACQFIRSESESSSSAAGHQYPDVNQYRGSSLLRNVNNVIDYVPQSEFLRKMKQQCQYLQNDQPNIFSTLDNCEQFSSDDCQRCIDTARLVLNMGDQIKCNKYKSPAGGPSQNYLCQEQFGRMNNVEGNQTYYKDPQYFCDLNNLNENQRLTRDARMSPKGKLECINEESNEKILQKPTKHKEKSAEQSKKSEHVSRSKKPAKCRGRRKRKSGSSDKCESGEEFEPNLKKPHENSCERCWKYASPSRSPVNKPDQRYDPNFRRGHSCVDFEMGDGNLEVSGRHISPCKNLQPIASRENVPAFSQTQTKGQQPEGSQQKINLSPRKAQLSPQETRFSQPATQGSPQAAQHGPRAAQFSPQKNPCIQQQPQDQDKPDTNFSKIKDLMYSYSQSKSPEKNAAQSQPSEGHRKSPNSSKILQSEAARKPRPKSYTAGAPALAPENLPDYILNATEYCDICLKPRPNSSQNETNKKCVRLSGNKAEVPVQKQGQPRPATADSPLKVGTPVPSNRPQFSPQISSTPKKSSKSKASSPDQCNNRPSGPSSPQSKHNSPKPKSPKSPTNVNFNKPGSPDSNATVYAEVIVKSYENPPTPKKPVEQSNQRTPSPKSKSKNGSSPKKSSKSGSPRKAQSSASLVENLSPIQEVRPQAVFVPPTEHDFYPGVGGVHDPVTGTHPIRDCWCPPRAPFIKGNICNNPNPGQIFCCHCNWEENKKNEEQRIRNHRVNTSRNERSGSQTGEVGERQCDNDRKGRPSERPRYEGIKLECPYRAFQREKKAANDTSWEEDYQRLKEYCLKNPGEVNYQLGNQTDYPSNRAEYLPTKYTVFYMTENKEDKGDDVEVLVEELTQVCPKKSDSRTQDITEKMKRILECPSDSMALRFQKGVSESCKAPRSSRILYF